MNNYDYKYSPPSQTAELLLVGSLTEPPSALNTKEHLDCSATQTEEKIFPRVSLEKILRGFLRHETTSRWHLDNSLVGLEDGIGVHLGALFLH